MEWEIPTFADVLEARRRIEPHLRPTPLFRYPVLDELLGAEVFVKHENHQPVGAFKVRGGVNLVSQLSAGERGRGVIAASTGNHGQSIAYAGRLFNKRVIIYSPAENVNELKMNAMRDLGAEVRLHGRDFDEARVETERVAREEGWRYVHSANEPHLISGVGTIGLEIFEDLPDVEVIIAPAGGGSCASGNCIVAKHTNPNVRVIAVQSEAAPAMWHAWRNRNLDPYPTMQTEHEGLATRIPFELTNRVLWSLLDDFVLVSDEEINEAVRSLARSAKQVVEGAGAASLAAAAKMGKELRGKVVVGVVSGGNIPPERFARVIQS
jgi:threonine dehydratase